ncbi:MAG: TonB-dependent receptor [Candidatus Marinimicrobia bacterium]|nr:TonB-dependent receptor [Candidatus Neomarinimicrobiota bacterium]
MTYLRSSIFMSLVVSYLFGGTTGKLTGLISDKESGEALIGCNVIISDTDLGTASNESGEYFILNIPPGKYSITFSMIGYETLVIEDVKISTDKTTRYNSSLGTTVLEGSEVIVRAERKLIQFDVTQSESRITADELDVMPVTEVKDVLRLQGGITQDAGGGLHMRGGRSSEISYLVDGVPMSDAYDGGISVQIENDNLQELQVISGTFNAEYGRALTGVINMITKDGGDSFKGFLNVYSGDHTTRDKVFKNLDSYNPFNDYSISANLNGPILPKKLTFYSSVRLNKSRGWMYGKQTFTMYGDTVFTDNNGNGLRDQGEALNVPEYEAMNWHDSWSNQNKLTLRISPTTKLRFNTIFNSGVNQGYDHSRQMAQDGRKKYRNQGQFLGLNLSRSFSSMSFMEINVSQYVHRNESYLFKNPLDSRYVTPDSIFWAHVIGEVPQSIQAQYGNGVNYFPQYTFSRWGVDTDRFMRETKTQSFKVDYTNQINKYNQVKMGADYSIHKLKLDSYALLDSSQSDQRFSPVIPDVGSFNRSTYDHGPTEWSIYVQDKVEYGDMIINAGLRYESFDPRSQTPNNIHEPYINDPRNPALDSLSLEELEDLNWGDTWYTEVDSLGMTTDHTYSEFYDRFNDQPDLINERGWWRRTTIKSQLSPRLAVAYPISDKGVIHFAYGYFFKTPDFSLLYNNTDYKLSETGTDFGIFGNPELRPETTISYELGLRQEIGFQTKIEIKGFYRDARNYVTSGIPIDLGDGKSYYTYVNKDYSNSRGIILTLFKQFSNFIGWQLDYTFQIAEGSNSNPNEEFGAVLAGKEPTRSIIPLDWDQGHNLNGSLSTAYKGWGMNTIFQYGSGYPYTPSITNYEQQGEVLSNVLLRNSRRKASSFRMDMKLFKNINIGKINGKIYMSIYNLLDRRNQNNVYSDSGVSDETIEQERAEIISPFEPLRPNTLNDFFERPDWYDEPREIQLGLQLSW